MRSSSAGLARPVRTDPNSPFVACTDLPMRSLASARSSFVISLIRSGRDQRAYALAAHYPVDVSLVVHVEDVERDAALHAERQRGEVHHAQPPLERLHVRDLLDELGVGVLARVGGEHPLDAVLRHEDRLGVDLACTQRRGGVGREERVAGTRREDHDAALLEVAHRAAADVGLGDLADVEGRLHARVHVELLERVLELQRVQDDREHAHVVGGRAVHALRRARDAAVDVAGPEHDRDLDAAIVHPLDLLCDLAQALEVGAVLEVAHERLAGQLEQDPPEYGGGAVVHSPTANRAKRRMTTFSPVFADRSARICSIVRDSCLSSLTCFWLRSTTSSSHFFTRPSTILGRMLSGLSAACCSKTRTSASLASSVTSSSETNCVVGEAAMCIATSLAKSMKSSFLATKSVLQSTSTSTPILPLAWMYDWTVPSVAVRSASLPILLPILTRRSSTARSMSPPDSCRADLQSIMPAPVRWRSSLTSEAEIVGVVMRSVPGCRGCSVRRSRPRGSSGRRPPPRPRPRRRDRARPARRGSAPPPAHPRRTAGPRPRRSASGSRPRSRSPAAWPASASGPSQAGRARRRRRRPGPGRPAGSRPARIAARRRRASAAGGRAPRAPARPRPRRPLGRRRPPRSTARPARRPRPGGAPAPRPRPAGAPRPRGARPPRPPGARGPPRRGRRRCPRRRCRRSRA